jgi:hypothetical protein
MNLRAGRRQCKTAFLLRTFCYLIWCRDSTPQLGKALTTMYLTAAFHVFVNDTFRYVREVIGENDAVLEFSVVIDGVTVNGVDMISWSSENRIIDFKVMLRPLMAITLIQQKMTAMLKAGRTLTPT